MSGFLFSCQQTVGANILEMCIVFVGTGQVRRERRVVKGGEMRIEMKGEEGKGYQRKCILIFFSVDSPKNIYCDAQTQPRC